MRPEEQAGNFGASMPTASAGNSLTGRRQYRGVRKLLHVDAWLARTVSWSGRRTVLGCFASDEEAARAYDLEALRTHGHEAEEFLNFPVEDYLNGPFAPAADSSSEGYWPKCLRLSDVKSELVQLRSAVEKRHDGEVSSVTIDSETYRGVSFFKPTGMWQAEIQEAGGRVICLGSFDSEVEAAQAFDRATIHNLSICAQTNFPVQEYLSGAVGVSEDTQLTDFNQDRLVEASTHGAAALAKSGRRLPASSCGYSAAGPGLMRQRRAASSPLGGSGRQPPRPTVTSRPAEHSARCARKRSTPDGLMLLAGHCADENNGSNRAGSNDIPARASKRGRHGLGQVAGDEAHSSQGRPLSVQALKDGRRAMAKAGSRFKRPAPYSHLVVVKEEDTGQEGQGEAPPIVSRVAHTAASGEKRRRQAGRAASVAELPREGAATSLRGDQSVPGRPTQSVPAGGANKGCCRPTSKHSARAKQVATAARLSRSSRANSMAAVRQRLVVGQKTSNGERSSRGKPTKELTLHKLVRKHSSVDIPLPTIRFRKGLSLYRGVTFHQRRWKAQLVFGKHVCHIGLFSSEADAAKAFDSEVVKIWGKSAESIINFSILDYSKEVAEAEARLRKLAGRKKPPAAKKHVAHSKSVGRKRPTRFETKTTTTRRSK
eukprot:CAMPEP_0117689234 /NCGR_PEP_ID=MMETSP0804-20121206/24357_1 /TAXON_ID=1074897 /ORGANISM="Tetraselmis astigmatica, Strain CCMP880" /LENGTH=655 /DNA_ID=CAMNT_0005501945 /DNA_START=796 /DNA_END=2763 /DNA_ORIENTATION=+